MRIPNRSNLISYTLFTASAVILVGVVYFALNIQVIRDWNLTLPSQAIHSGDTIVVASTYTKLKQVTGTSTRTIECEASKGIFVSYPLNKAVANRAPGNTGTGLVISIPNAMEGVTTLPDTCHICVALSYPVLPFRTVPYFRCTSDFTLLPKSVSSAAVSASATRTSQSQTSSVSHSQPGGSALVSSSPNTTSSGLVPQSENPQQTSDNSPAQPSQPSLVQQILQPIKNLIGGL